MRHKSTPLIGIIPFFIIVLAITGCQNDCKVDPVKVIWSSKDDACVSVTVDPSAYSDFMTDSFILEEVQINGDSLKIKVQYGGGCGEAAFGLLTDAYFMESHPVQLNLRLVLKNMDPCDAIVQRSLCFDLSELSEIFNSYYQSVGGTIILHLKDYESPIPYNF